MIAEPAPTKAILLLELFLLFVVVGSNVWFLSGLELGDEMRFENARQAWHDAFDTATQQSDYAAILGGQTVLSRGPKHYIDEIRDDKGKVTARLEGQVVYATETIVRKGSSGRIMDACEKGLVQSIIAELRKQDPLAYCWGMAAYAPPAVRFKERAALLQYLMTEFDKWNEPRPRERVSQLALFCINACALRDVNGRKVDVGQARVMVGCKKLTWDQEWKSIWRRFQRRLDPLPCRALAPVSEIVEFRKIMLATG